MKSLISAVLICICFSFSARAALSNDFNIIVDVQGGLTASQQTIFADAEAFWESFIVAYQDGIATDGLVISANGVAIDGAGGILGQAGPTTVWDAANGYTYALSGLMQFDTADLTAMENAGTLFDVILHEMAHVIGFGTLWGALYNDLLNAQGNYIGEFALDAYRFEMGDNSLDSIPVEQGGGAGTAGAHWDETDGGGDTELMSGWLDSPATLSLTTVLAFADLGYVVDLSAFFQEPEPVPEPQTILLLLAAMLGFVRFKTKANVQ